jgi:hypothetical protein
MLLLKYAVCMLFGASDVQEMDTGDIEKNARARYRKRSLSEHPDKGGSARGFGALTAAHDIVRKNLWHVTRMLSSNNSDTDGESVTITQAERSALLSHPFLDAVCFLLVHIASVQSGGKAPAICVDVLVSLEDVYASITKCVHVPVLRWKPRRERNTDRDIETTDTCIDRYVDTTAGNSSCGLDDIDDVFMQSEEEAMVLRSVTVLVPITADTVHAQEYVFSEVGHDALFEGMTRGDIRVAVRVKPHPVYNIDSVVSQYDLHATIPVSIRDYYYGRTVKLPPLARGDAELVLRYEPSSTIENSLGEGSLDTHRRCVHLLRGHGLPRDSEPEVHYLLDDDSSNTNNDRGDLYVFFDLTLPCIPQRVLSKPHVRMFFEMVFGSMMGPASHASHTNTTGS